VSEGESDEVSEGESDEVSEGESDEVSEGESDEVSEEAMSGRGGRVALRTLDSSRRGAPHRLMMVTMAKRDVVAVRALPQGWRRSCAWG
jgi:hypothetical protein